MKLNEVHTDNTSSTSVTLTKDVHIRLAKTVYQQQPLKRFRF
jgi:hypothetical protein